MVKILQVPAWFYPLEHTENDWQFRSEPSDKMCRSMKNGCYWPRGKMLGGSHGINALIYLRGNKRDYDDWAAMDNPTWDWDSVVEYFKKTETNVNQSFVDYQNGKWHSKRGEMPVGHYYQPEVNRQVVFDAAIEKGYDVVHDFNSDLTLGFANVQGTIKNGQRMSTAKSLLVPAKNRKNLHIIKYAHVTKILLDSSNTATGVEFTYKKEHKLVAKANKEVILSAGAVGSPQLLMLSGIGPKEHLEELGIEVKKDLPVGKNLQDHVIVPIVFQLHKSTAESESMIDVLDEVYNYAIHRTGQLAGIGTINLVAFVNTENHTGYPDIELQYFDHKKKSLNFEKFLRTVGYAENVVKALVDANNEGEVSDVYVELLRPESTGEILLRSKDPFDKPKIYPNYFSNEDDVKTLIRGIRFQVDFENTKAFKEHEGVFVRIPFDDCDKLEYMSDDYWRCYMTHMATTVYHPAGTAKMSNSHKDAVVDSELRVKGVNQLRVIDASVMPKVVSANTNAATIMIGEKGADFIKATWTAKSQKNEL